MGLIALIQFIRLPWSFISGNLGVLAYLQLGVSPKWFGFIMLVITEAVVVANWERWNLNTISASFLIANLALVGMVALLFPNEDKEESMEGDVLRGSWFIRFREPGMGLTERIARVWFGICWVVSTQY